MRLARVGPRERRRLAGRRRRRVARVGPAAGARSPADHRRRAAASRLDERRLQVLDVRRRASTRPATSPARCTRRSTTLARSAPIRSRHVRCDQPVESSLPERLLARARGCRGRPAAARAASGACPPGRSQPHRGRLGPARGRTSHGHRDGAVGSRARARPGSLMDVDRPHLVVAADPPGPRPGRGAAVGGHRPRDARGARRVPCRAGRRGHAGRAPPRGGRAVGSRLGLAPHARLVRRRARRAAVRPAQQLPHGAGDVVRSRAAARLADPPHGGGGPRPGRRRRPLRAGARRRTGPRRRSPCSTFCGSAWARTATPPRCSPARRRSPSQDRAVVAVEGGPADTPRRLSLTLPVLSAARRVFFVVSSTNKADAVATALEYPPALRSTPCRRPRACVPPRGGCSGWSTRPPPPASSARRARTPRASPGERPPGARAPGPGAGADHRGAHARARRGRARSRCAQPRPRRRGAATGSPPARRTARSTAAA